VVILIVCQCFGEARGIMGFILYKGFNSYYMIEMQRAGLSLLSEINH
jgi:hypothetical protein